MNFDRHGRRSKPALRRSFRRRSAEPRILDVPRSGRGLVLVGLGSLVALALWSVSAVGYPVYREPGSTTANPAASCYSCHPGFFNRGVLHNSLHVGTNNMTGTCTLCHTSTGDIPKTNSSGTDHGHACNGCHMGPGLRRHHAAAGAPADSTGLVCADCHDDPAPPGESTLPPYYSRTDVKLKDPCLVSPALGGEDYTANGKGLDNDGDLTYDQSDSDCGGVPAEMSTWGHIKALYR